MKRDILISLDNLSNIQKIPLDLTPQQTFSIAFENGEYEIDLRTHAGGNTFLTITKEGEALCVNASIKTGIDLIFTSKEREAVFFFLSETSKSKETPYSWQDFEALGFYYADI